MRRALVVARALVGRRRLTALLLAVATATALLVLSGAPGLTQDEAALVARAEPAGAAGAVVAAARAALGGVLGELRAVRAGSALAGGALTALLALLGATIAGPGGIVLAPLLFWLAPRHLQAGLSAAPDVAAAALALAVAWSYRRAALAQRRRDRLRAGVSAGVLLGAALALRPDAWILLVALVSHAAILRLARAPVPKPAGAEPAEGLVSRLHGAALALVAMAVIAPALLVVATPSLLADPAAGLTALAEGQLRGRFGPGPISWLVLTVPAGLLAAYAGGLLHAAWRALRALRARAPAELAADDLLLVLVPAAYLAAGHLGLGAPGAGLRPWLPALPFLALTGARALLAAAALVWPRRESLVAAALTVLVIAPGAWAAARAFPLGASAWNELAGGAPGAAARGLPRQDGGEAMLALLAEVNARALPGARVLFARIPPAAVALYARDGFIRSDLAVATGPEDADLAVVWLDGGSRDEEYQSWGALRTDRPAAGVYRDEVPLAFVYAREGSWR